MRGGRGTQSPAELTDHDPQDSDDRPYRGVVECQNLLGCRHIRYFMENLGRQIF